jgi:hypothetical protein
MAATADREDFMKRRSILLIALCWPLSAQWLRLPDKAIPRKGDGTPDLTAAAPKKTDGKPDLSGIWLSQGAKYLINLAADLKLEDLQMQPWAEALVNERKGGARGREESDAACLPQGVPKINVAPLPFKIIQDPGLIVILYEAFGQFRQVFMDGRELPKDPNPTWLGYSVGKWDGDTLVVESSGFNAKAWLDQAGHPATEALHVTERFRRPDFGHLQIQVTIDDPKAYGKAWTATQSMNLLADTDLLEFVCNENERDLRHLNVK